VMMATLIYGILTNNKDQLN